MLRWVGRAADACGMVAAAACLGLIIVTLYEVVARYVFRAPTVWGFDVGYMLNGTAFVLAAAMTLRANQHVSVDILSLAMPRKLRRAIDAAVFAALIVPALALITHAAWGQFIRAWVSGEVGELSPWRPVMWPFGLVLAVGLTALTLQAIARIFEPPPQPGAH
jgi:TRAP-type mannitol/chloroaromatic compound transport system permease small subunit